MKMNEPPDNTRKGFELQEFAAGAALGGGVIAGSSALAIRGSRETFEHALGKLVLTESERLHGTPAIQAGAHEITDVVGLAMLQGNHGAAPDSTLLNAAHLEAEALADAATQPYREARLAADKALKAKTSTVMTTPARKAEMESLHHAYWEIQKRKAVGSYLAHSGSAQIKAYGESMLSTAHVEQQLHTLKHGGLLSRMRVGFSGLSGGAKAGVCLGAAAIAMGGSFLVHCWRNGGHPENLQSASPEQAEAYQQAQQQLVSGPGRG